MLKKFQGLFVALATFYHRQEVDTKTLTTYLEWLLAQGVDGLVACGTTGESLALSFKEQSLILEATLTCTRPHQVPVIAGVSAPTLSQALDQAHQAQHLGVDGLLLLTPFYVKPSQSALLTFFEAVHDATSLPLILYHNPSRAGVELTLETIVTLAKRCPRVIGLKDASPDLTRPLRLRQHLPEGFALLSGDDPTYPAFLSVGGDGIISVTGGLVPGAFRALRNAFQAGQTSRFLQWSQVLFSLCDAMFETTSPGPLKHLLKRAGFGDASTRLPLTFPDAAACRRLEQAFEQVRSFEPLSL